MELKMKLVYFLSAFFFFTVFSFGQNEVKTKMALLLKKNDDFVRLKANDRIKVNDKFFIVVQPLSDSYNYVIFTEGNETSLLNNLKDVKIKKNNKLILPSNSDYFQFDGNSSNAEFNIISSSKSLAEIDNLFKTSSTIETDKWKKVEEKLVKDNKVNLNDDSNSPISIAGNVRSIDSKEIDKHLLTFSDKKLILKKYKLEIKK